MRERERERERGAEMELGFMYLIVGAMFSELVWPENKIVVKIVFGCARETTEGFVIQKNCDLRYKKKKKTIAISEFWSTTQLPDLNLPMYCRNFDICLLEKPVVNLVNDLA